MTNRELIKRLQDLGVLYTSKDEEIRLYLLEEAGWDLDLDNYYHDDKDYLDDEFDFNYQLEILMVVEPAFTVCTYKELRAFMDKYELYE